MVAGNSLVAFALLSYGGLHALRDDPLYSPSNATLPDMLEIIKHETLPTDVVLLSNLAYERFFTSNESIASPRVVGLPFQPGERPSPEQPAKVVSSDPDALVNPTTGPFIFALAAGREKLWLLVSSGPFIPWSVRPVERFMAAHYYPIGEFSTSPQVRLIEYSTIQAPDTMEFRGAQQTTDLIYGSTIHLLGYNLPEGNRYQPGDILPISLYWQTDSVLTQSYTVAWFLATNEGTVAIQGWDLAPGGGFAPTNSWRPGAPVWDNRAMRLPADLTPGTYRLWVVVYSTDLNGSITNLPVIGSETREGSIGLLPATIEISKS